MGNIKVSILLVTYNQEELVKEAVKSIVEQEKPWNYEVVVADDYSSDNTINSVKEVFDLNKINYRVLQSEKNLAISHNYKRAFPECKGDYIAVLEGDDYWTDNQRLIKHVNFLD